MKFAQVPGVKRTFLVGDGREYNVLLIVPDMEDPVLRDQSAKGKMQEYFQRLVTAANSDLAPYERVVNFALLPRDFSLDREELTPKGSFRRKTIEKNFATIIEEQYKRKTIELEFGSYKILIPRWFFRDLGVLETDISVIPDGLFNQRNGRFLPIEEHKSHQRVRLGDLEYIFRGKVIDLGMFARQPKLWLGNSTLTRFCPCREGWETPMKQVDERVFIPPHVAHDGDIPIASAPTALRNMRLLEINELVQKALFEGPSEALEAVEKLGEILANSEERMGTLIRYRLETLAHHPSEGVRCAAYRILLLDRPMPDYGRAFPAFIESGLPFLNEESIRMIAQKDLKQRRLEALRRRMHSYRTTLDWPGDENTREQFKRIFNMLVKFVREHREYYAQVRSELACWVLHHDDQQLADDAKEKLLDMVTWYESTLSHDPLGNEWAEWEKRLVFDDNVTQKGRERIRKVLEGTTFLKQSVILAYDGDDFALEKVPANGIWISRILSHHQFQRYRMSVNVEGGRHFDLQLLLREDFEEEHVIETMYWSMAIAGYPFRTPPLPRFGCCRPELGAMSLVFLSDLTVWERIREYAGRLEQYRDIEPPNTWRKLFIRAFATIFKAWNAGGKRVIPGHLSAANVVVPGLDFRVGAAILSLTNWSEYRTPGDLIIPIVRNFYRKTIAHYPWCEEDLDYRWIYDGAIEALGQYGGIEFLQKLYSDLQEAEYGAERDNLEISLADYLNLRREEYYVPLPVQNAIDRFREMLRFSPRMAPRGREELLLQLFRAYRLGRYPEIARYHFYRHTYFYHAKKRVRKAFDALLEKMFRDPDRPATQRVELSDLHASLENAADREVFSRLVFPRHGRRRPVEVMTVGQQETPTVIVQSEIEDRYGKQYIIREPLDPSEIAQVYRLFYQEKYPKEVSEQDYFYVALDDRERIVAGLCYQTQGADVVSVEAMAVTKPLQRRGLGGALLDDVCARMAERGVDVVKLHFLLRELGSRVGFALDERWGGLVRVLTPEDRLVTDERVSPDHQLPRP
ncbi:GNAT family N-acetyltransferase [bacterium]|nr:GNAT family N-acetyltransferase [bacterium]